MAEDAIEYELLGGPCDGLRVRVNGAKTLILPTLRRRVWIPASEFGPAGWGMGQEVYEREGGHYRYKESVGELIADGA